MKQKAGIELYLLDYWHARRSAGRLMTELAEAKAAYELGASALPSAGGVVRAGGRRRRGGSPVERAAVLLADQLGAEVAAIERRLEEERRVMAEIEAAVKAAGLSRRETEFVRQRYFENRTLEATAQRLYCSVSTCWRIKNSVMRKVGAVSSGLWREAQREA